MTLLDVPNVMVQEESMKVLVPIRISAVAIVLIAMPVKVRDGFLLIKHKSNNFASNVVEKEESMKALEPIRI